MATYTYEALSDFRSQDNTARRSNKRTATYTEETQTRVSPCAVVDRLWSKDPSLQRYSIVVGPPASPTVGEVQTALGPVVVDWDSGVDRVIGFKKEEFQLLSALGEMRELKTLLSSFIVRATGMLNQFREMATSLLLLNNLVVVPTVGDFVALSEDIKDAYDKVFEALRRIQVPTKFSTKQVTRSVSFRGDEQVLYIADYGFSGGFYIYGTPQHRIVSKKRGSGRVSASPFINTVALSAMTSNYSWDWASVWNFIPFSFILDYFLPIAEALESKSSDFCTFAITDAVVVEEMTIQSRWCNIRYAQYGLITADNRVTIDMPSNLVNNRYVRRFNRELTSDTPLDGKTLVIEPVPDLSLTQGLNTFVIGAHLLGAAIINRRPSMTPILRPRF